jgi:hypothetical protein
MCIAQGFLLRVSMCGTSGQLGYIGDKCVIGIAPIQDNFIPVHHESPASLWDKFIPLAHTSYDTLFVGRIANVFSITFSWLRKYHSPPESDPVACILLSIKFDPFIVTAYLRQEAFGGMTRRDWRIFLLSWLIANAWWSVVCFTGLSAVQWVWAWMRG